MRYQYRTLVFRRLIVNFAKQGGNAPFIDQCWGNGESRKDNKKWPRTPTFLAPECRFRFTGRAILLAPWRRDSYGERPPMRALTIGWITSREPLPPGDRAPAVAPGTGLGA